MKNLHDIEMSRKEDQFVNATLAIGDIQVVDVPCKIYLPERNNQKPCIIIKPIGEEMISNLRFKTNETISFYAETVGWDDQIELQFEASELYFSNFTIKSWGKNLSDCTIICEPQNLYETRFRKCNDGASETNITFWISSNPLLQPDISPTESCTGEIELHRLNLQVFKIDDNITLTFDKHFSSKKLQDGDVLRWEYLVATTQTVIPDCQAKEINNLLLPSIDDFLRISSFAARRRTVCLGWSAYNKIGYTKFYRGNYVFPSDDSPTNKLDSLIPKNDFNRFQTECFKTFINYKNKFALRHALNSAIPYTDTTLESSYLRKFAGLETLILDFRRSENLEFILPRENFTDFRVHIENSIKSFNQPKLDKQQKASLYSKIPELNRISLREAYEAFRKHYSVDLSDLWPLFGSKKLVGLTDIRNKLIHGDPFPQNLHDSLAIANLHLAFTLERVLIKVLGWDIKGTRVSPYHLQSQTMIIANLELYRKKLSEYVFSDG